MHDRTRAYVPEPSASQDATVPPAPRPGSAAAVPGDARAPAGYAIEKELGRGGMGVVYQARSLTLNRVCALKMILSGAHSSAAEAARFRTEAQSIARLQHPGIVQVFEVGAHDGKPFMALEYCGGGSLDALLAKAPLPPADAATLVQALAEAMQAAHAAHVLHRDLKPANVLLTERGEPKVTDFGLAKKLDEQSQTQTGAVMGTPSYMAPEQAEGSKDVGPPADVYALGAILYECLALRPPFRSATPLDTIRQVLTEEPVPLRQLNRQVPVDLETIAHKCLQKDPAKRYASARALADDLARFRNGEPILARPVGALERGLRWVKRRPAAAALIAVSAVAALGLFVGSLVYNADLGAALSETRSRAEEANRQRQQAVTNLYHSLVREAQALRRSRAEGYRALAWERLEQALSLDTPDRDRARLRQEAVACLGDFVGQRPTVWSDFPGKIQTLAVGPGGGEVAAGMADGSIVLRDRATGQQTAQLRGHCGPVTALRVVDEGRRLLSGGADGVIKIWEHTAGMGWTCLRPIDAGAPVRAFAANGLVAVATRGTSVTTWDLEKGVRAGTLELPPGESARSVSLSADGSLLAAVHQSPANPDGTVVVWDAVGRKQKWPPVMPKQTWLFTCGFSGDGRFLACSGSGGTEVFDTTTGQLQPAPRGDLVRSVALDGDGRLMALAMLQAQTILLWDHASHRELATLRLPGPPQEVVLSADGRTLAALLEQGVQVWDLGGTGEKRDLTRHTRGVAFLAFSSDGQRLASAGHDRVVRVTAVADARLIKELPLAGAAQGVAWSPDDRYLATSTLVGQDLRLWDTHTWQPTPVQGHELGSIYSVSFSPDGRLFAACGGGGVTVWRCDPPAAPGAPLALRRVARFKEDTAASLCFSPDGRLLAWAHFRGPPHVSTDNRVRLVEVNSWRPRSLDVRTMYGIMAVSFSPDGKRLITVSPRSEIEHLDLASGERLSAFGAADLRAGAVLSTKTALTADGQLLAVGNRFISVWDNARQSPLLLFPAEHSPVWSLAWSPDGNDLAIGSSDGDVAVWNIPRIRAQLTQIGLGW